jgi:hypothetical protein
LIDKIWIELRPDFGIKCVWVVEYHPQKVAEFRHCYYLLSDRVNPRLGSTPTFETVSEERTVALLPQTSATIGRLEPFTTVNLAVKK